MTDRIQLAEDAAYIVGWSVAGPDGHYDRGGNRVPAPSLDDPAFCWAMLEWLLARDEALLLGRDGTFDRRPYGQHELGAANDWPEALARAVVAAGEAPMPEPQTYESALRELSGCVEALSEASDCICWCFKCVPAGVHDDQPDGHREPLCEMTAAALSAAHALLPPPIEIVAKLNATQAPRSTQMESHGDH